MEHRILLIGHGSISKTYVEKISGIEGMTVAGVVGRDFEKTGIYADKYGISRYGTDIEKVAHQSGATMALVCTPNAAHYEGVCAAAALGLDILCEKPLHIHPAKQDEMIKICQQKNVKLGVCFMRRFHKHLQYVKRFLDDGGLGEILVMDVRLKDWRKPEYYSESSWHGTWEHDGGGPFIQQGSHIIDVAQWLGNGFEKVINAKMFTVLHPIEVEDLGYALVKFSNGAVGMIQASTVCKGFFANEVEITGTKGSIVVTVENIKRWDVEGADEPKFPQGEDVFREILLDFKKAIETSREPFVTGQSGKVAVDLICEIYKKAGKPLKL